MKRDAQGRILMLEIVKNLEAKGILKGRDILREGTDQGGWMMERRPFRGVAPTREMRRLVLM